MNPRSLPQTREEEERRKNLRQEDTVEREQGGRCPPKHRTVMTKTIRMGRIVLTYNNLTPPMITPCCITEVSILKGGVTEGLRKAAAQPRSIRSTRRCRCEPLRSPKSRHGNLTNKDDQENQMSDKRWRFIKRAPCVKKRMALQESPTGRAMDSIPSGGPHFPRKKRMKDQGQNTYLRALHERKSA